MLTKEDMKKINNKLRGTGAAGDKYLDAGYNTIRNSTNSFLLADAPQAMVQEIQMPEYTIDIKAMVQEPANKSAQEQITQPVKEQIQEVELNVPYFVTPFYMECKMQAERENTTIDAVAFERLAKHLGITVRRTVRLVQEGLIEVRF